MSIVLVTGSTGPVGSETVRFFCEKGFEAVGIDRGTSRGFWDESSAEWTRLFLEKGCRNYTHFRTDISDKEGIAKIFKKYGSRISLIVHTAEDRPEGRMPVNPVNGFSINTTGTLVALESMRSYCPEAVFIFTSTNRVYGESPNKLPFVELDTRYDLDSENKWYAGIDETMSLDGCRRGIFGGSKAAADFLVQEYGRCFGLKTACFRIGNVTAPSHFSTRHNGFLSHILNCIITGEKFEIYGYKGKQVRDVLHSGDLIEAFYHLYKNPGKGEVYNIGGGRCNSISIIEAIDLCQEETGKKLLFEYTPENRAEDLIWWVTGTEKFNKHYPEWRPDHDSVAIVREVWERHKNVLNGSFG